MIEPKLTLSSRELGLRDAPDEDDFVKSVWIDEGDDDDLMVVSGQGGWLTDRLGRRIYEGASGHSCLNLGYANDELIEVAAASFRRLSYCSPEHLTTPVAQLSYTLARLLGGDYSGQIRDHRRWCQ
jgi:adenosylmethionine-8-amino-7-oxononanoate aminotransferase